MIIHPYNDHECLGAISQFLQSLVDEQHPALVELARRYYTPRMLADYIRARPQRDDIGNPDDGPRVAACTPSQRLRINPEDPNCVERAALFAAVAALIDPALQIQLATVNTPLGLHTIPVVNNKAVRLDPGLTDESVDFGLAMCTPGPVAVEPRQAVAWTLDLAGQQAQQVRNGSTIYPVGSRAVHRLLDEGKAPSPREVETMGLVFALAERAADRYGTRAIAIVRAATRALSELLDIVLAQRRNAGIDFAGLKFDTPGWLDSTATALGHFGVDVGGAVARHKLETLNLAAMLGLSGGTAGLIGLLEAELGKQGRTLGSVAHPPALATFAHLAAPRVA